MVDIHTHILWAVDDGPEFFEQSIELIKQAVQEGITDIIVTSHSWHPLYNVSPEKVTEQLLVLQEVIKVNNLPLTLHAGHEVRIGGNIIDSIKTKKIHTLANSNYLLLELPSDNVPYYTIPLIRELLSEGIIPIIAHPERNKAIVDRPELLARLINEGAVAQITAGSLAGHFGRKIQSVSLDFVKANLVHTYGSDVHHIVKRPFLYNEGLEYLEKKKESEAIDILLDNNERILKNKPMLIQEPEKIQPAKWWAIF